MKVIDIYDNISWKKMMSQEISDWKCETKVMSLFLKFDLDLTFRCHSRSKVMMPDESSYMSLYKSSIVTSYLRYIYGFKDISIYMWYWMTQLWKMKYDPKKLGKKHQKVPKKLFFLNNVPGVIRVILNLNLVTLKM